MVEYPVFDGKGGMMRFIETILGWIVYGLLWTVNALFALLPAKKAYGFGCGFAAMLYPFFRKRRKLSIDNIMKAGITSDPEEAAKISKDAFCHLSGHIFEALKVPGVVTKDNWREHLDFSEASPAAAKLLLEETDRPIILVSSHHGVWEAATNTLSFARPMIAIARTMNNPLAAKWMKRHHFRGPVTVIDKKNGFTHAIMDQWVRESAAMTILVDQHYSKGMELKFMGRRAKCFTSATRLAIKTGDPIVVGSFVRKEPFKYALVGGDPVSFPKGTDIGEATQLLNDRLEDAIRRYPSQYLWMHRRWRLD